MRNQAEIELTVFRRFVQVAGLAVIAESVEKRDPPEPDVRCNLEDGEQLAFELVEICNPTNARFLSSAKRICDMIMFTYGALPPPARDAFDGRFINTPLSFYFHPDASLAVIRNVLPSLLDELIYTPEHDSEYSHFSPGVAKAVTKVRHGGQLFEPGKVNFNLGGHFDRSAPLVAVAAKLSKRYKANCGVEMLAHFSGSTWEHGRFYPEPIKMLLRERGLGPFRRIWVMDSQGIGMVFPEPSHSIESRSNKVLLR